MNSTLEAEDVVRKTGHGGERPGSGRPKSNRDDVTVKLDRSIAARAHFVAKARGMTLAEYLSEITKGVVDRDFDQEARRTQEKN